MYKQGMYELPQELPIELKFSNLGNQEKLGISENCGH